ncbi:hypothetical protein ASD37_20685 [Mycobacterium sp. Root135]|uniref:WXG100 family type VII secretion target n=1 Tax=Mycobacterium sp. Root135 TaxID=1736457 RepID=UPI0006FC5C0D|nr:hypothetical protein [Mycobacterium sp. Root135]KQY04348.1 hypothetical protein ASD37_20685 [Mycobacterium sp. Root135]
MAPPITVDPTALAAIGTTVAGEGDAVAAAVGSLDSSLSGAGALFGHDAAGLVFAQGYTASGKALLDAAASAVNAGRRVGFGIQTSAANYGHANASSTVGGGTSAAPAPAAPAGFTAPGMPPPLGSGVAAPVGWALVEAFVGDVWPDGNPGDMRAAAGAWRTFAATITGLAGQVEAAGPGLSAQQIPESGQMTDALGKIGGGLTKIANGARTLATSVDGFAATVDATQTAVRNLLHQLSPAGVLETIGGIFTGHNPLDEIKKIADEIKTVLNNMKREADALTTVFNQGINELDSATNSLEAWATKEFTSVLGQAVGGALAFEFNAIVDGSEGGLKFVAETAQGIGQLDPTRFLYDPSGAAKTWEGLGETAAVLTNPALLASTIASDPEGALDTVKNVVDWKDVEAGHPFRALGYDVAQVGSFLIPGAGEADVAADGAGIAGRAASAEERAAAGAARDGIPGLGVASAESKSIASQAGRVGSDLDGIKVPESSTPGAAPGESAPTGRPPVDTAPPPAPAPEPHATEPGSPSPAEPAPPHADAPVAPHGSESPPPHADAPAAPHADAPPPSHGSEPAQVAESNPSHSSGGPSQPGSVASEPPAAANHGGELSSPVGADDKVPVSVGAHSGEVGDSAGGSGHGVGDHGSGGSGHGSSGPGHGSDGGSVHGNHDSSGSSGDEHGEDHQPGDHSDTSSGAHDPVHTANDLNDAFRNGLPTEDLARQVAEGATHHVGDSDRVVLGKYDGQDGGYIGEAKHHGGIYYDTGKDVWDAVGDGLAPEQSKALGWEVNEQFLRMQMEDHVSWIEYVLPDGFDSVDQVARVRRETFSALEINFLNENASRYGYVRDGNSWVLRGSG